MGGSQTIQRNLTLFTPLQKLAVTITNNKKNVAGMKSRTIVKNVAQNSGGRSVKVLFFQFKMIVATEKGC